MEESFGKLTLRYLLISLAIILGGGSITGYVLYQLNKDLPALEKLEKFEPDLISRVYSADGVVLKEFHAAQRRFFVPLSDIPRYVVDALITTEDKNFYDHWGMNVKRTIKAAVIDVLTMSKTQGASTLSQQLARNLHLTLEKTYVRKIKELLTAIKIEKTYTKDEILEMYLNTIYFGHGVYGIQAAAQEYFNKDVQNLNLDEAAMLIGILPAPAPYSPITHHDRAIKRRNIVLKNMEQDGKLSRWEYVTALSQKTEITQQEESIGLAPYFTEYIRQEISRETDVDINRGGLEIYTTLYSNLQNLAEESLHKQLDVLQENLDKRLKNSRDEMLSLTTDSAAATLPMDSLYDEVPTDSKIVQGAFMAIDPHNGAIRVMIGGRDFKESKFNRCYQGTGRQPGSTFKPIVFTAAIDNGYTTTTQLLNQPVVIPMPDGSRWAPDNYDHSSGGLTTLRDALRRSLNRVAVRVVQELVDPRIVKEYAQRMGFTTNIRPVDAIALGTSEVLLYDLVAAYGIYANEGIYNRPYAIEKVLDRNGNVIYRSNRETREVLSKETAYIMTNMLQSVMDAGTGGSARWRFGFRAPAGGKTGTTNAYTDAWFVGFTRDLVAGTWVGVDNPAVSLGNGYSGSRAALPIWATFMKKTYDEEGWKPEDFVRPPGVKEYKICSESKLLPTEYCPVEKEIFNVKNPPKTVCDIHGKAKKTVKPQRIDF